MLMDLQTKGEFMKKLYVGNLSYDVTKEELEKIFSEYGSVSDAIIISDRDSGRPKGFGFVEMEDSSEADKAIKELDGKTINDRNIRVNEARPKTSHPRGGSGGGSGGRNQRRR